MTTQKTSRKPSKKATSPKSPKKAGTGHASRTERSTRSASAPELDELTMDRRRAERRDSAESLETSHSTLERRKKVNRRRQIDPTTCERDYTDQEIEFMNALDDYKRKSGRMFPTCSEVLEVIQSLGYVKISPAERGALGASTETTASAKPMPGLWPAVAEASTNEPGLLESGLESPINF